MKDSKLEQESEKRFKLISAKLNEGNFRAEKRLAASDDTVAPFANNSSKKIQSKHPPRVPNHAQQVVEDSLTTFEPTVAKTINSFPSGHREVQGYLCPSCTKTFRQEQRLHRQRVPPEANKRTYYCFRQQNPCILELFLLC